MTNYYKSWLCNTFSNHKLTLAPSAFFKKVLYVFALFFLTATSWGQTTVQIGSGNTRSSSVPIVSNYGYSYSENIYLASEFNSAGGTGLNMISKIRFYYNGDGSGTAAGTAITTTTFNNWKIFLGNTSKTTFTSTTNWATSNSLTEVFNGDVTFPAPGNWMEITLSTPFIWDGTSNIIVAVDENKLSYGTLAYWGARTASVSSRGIYYRSDTNNPDPQTPPTGTISNNSPFIQFVASLSTPCSGTPTPGTIASNTSQNLCSGVTPAALTVTGTTSGVTGITFQWEQSTDNATWANVSTGTGATTATYTPPAFGGTTIYYRCKVSCTSSSLSDVSNVATIAPPANPTTQASIVTFTNVNYTSFTASWTNGNGNRRVVYVSDAAITDPTNNTGAAALTASTTYSGTGQQIVYDGTGTSVSVTGLTLGTTYNVKVIEYTRCGSTTYDNYFNVTSGTNSSSVTTTAVTAVPWNEGFATTTLPSGWLNPSSLSIGASVSSLNPALATNYMYVNLYDDWDYPYTTANFSTPIFAALPANYRLVFDYKINNYSASTAPGSGTGNVVVAISTNNGSSFTTLQTIDNNGITGWQNVVIDLSSYAGQNIRLKFTSNLTAYYLDYYVGFDNFKIEEIPVPTITTVTSSVACGPTSSVITITGAGLTNATSVKVGGTTITPLTTNTDTQITATVSSAVSGTVEVITNAGSVTSSGTVSFAISPALTLNSATQNNCAGVTNSALTTLTSTVADYDTYTWSPSTNVSGDATNGWSFNPTATTTYTLTASNSAGCSRTATKTVTVNAVPSAVVISPSTSVVAPGSTTALIASGGTITNSSDTTIGTGTSITGATAQPTAFCNRYDHYWSQTVFTAAELNAAGIQAGNITAIKFNITAQGSANTVTDFKVRIGTTSNNTLSSFQTTGLTQVFNVATYNIAIGVNTITFNTPYVWDGVSNILLDVRQTGVDLSNNTTTYYTTTTGNTVVYATTSTQSTSDGFAGSNPSAVTSTNRLNTTFVWDSSVATSTTWSPITDLYTDAGATSAYTGGAATTVYAKPTATTTYTATATSPSGCTSNSSTTLKIGNTWTGTTSNAWSTASNWSANAVPTATDDVLISSDGSNAPMLDVDVTIPAGKSLTINGAGTLTIAPGKVLTIAGAADFGGRPVIFKSDATGAGMFGQLTGTLTGATNVQVERFIPARRAYRFLSPAVTTSTTIRQNWQEDGGTTPGLGTHITGIDGATNGFDPTETNNSSLLLFTSGAWVGATSTTVGLTAGNAYCLMVRGDRTTNLTTNTPTPTNTVLRATGTLFTGDFSPVLSAVASGYSFIGNPYQAPLDIKTALATSSSNVNINAVYYWDPTINARGGYITRNLQTSQNSPSSSVNDYVQPGQAIFVVNKITLTGTPALTFTENHKSVANAAAGVFRNVNTSEYGTLRVNLQANTNNQWQTIEGALAIFNDNFSWNVTSEDATKFANLDEDVSFVQDNTSLAIACQSNPITTSELPIKIDKMRHTNYKWQFELDNYDGATPYLFDTLNNSYTQINNGTVVPFTADANTTNRFKIVFQNAVLSNATFQNTLAIYPNPAKAGASFYIEGVSEATVTVSNLLGQTVPVQTKSQGTTLQVTPNTSLSQGVYLVNITSEGNTQQVKWIVE